MYIYSGLAILRLGLLELLPLLRRRLLKQTSRSKRPRHPFTKKEPPIPLMNNSVEQIILLFMQDRQKCG